MKKLTVIVTLFVAFTLAACKKNPTTPTIPTKSLKEALVGKWKWMKNEGESFDSKNNSWVKLSDGEDYSSRDCYQEYKLDGSGLEHFVYLNNTTYDRVFTWSIKDEKNFYFKKDNNVNTFKNTIIKIDEHTLIYASEGAIDAIGRTIRGVSYFTK